MNKETLLKELHASFKIVQDDLNFKTSFTELNKIIFIEDMVLADGYVSNNLSRQIINRIVEMYYGQIGVFHSWLMAPPHDMIYMSEAKKLNEEERKDIFKTISEIMYFVRKNKRISFEKNKISEGKFIDELMNYYNERFNNFMLKYHKKFEDFWKEG